MDNIADSALILEGGAMRGLFTAGVLDVFMENGIAFSHAVGVSAGAVFGSNFKSGQIGRCLRYNLRFCHDWRYCSFRSLILTGDLYGADFCYRELPERLDPFDYAAFENNHMTFDFTVTDAETGKPFYYRAGKGEKEDLLWMRASASMPILSTPVLIDGKRYLDGGIADPIPYLYIKDKGFSKKVVILTQPRSYMKSSSSSIYRLFFHGKTRGIADSMERRAELYNKTRDIIFSDEAKGEVFVIAPDKALDVKRTEKDRKKLQKCYDDGVSAASSALPALINYLNS